MHNPRIPPKLYQGNRLERLAAVFAEVLAAPLSSPMMPETVVVQSPGMGHWLSMHLARRHGICANVRFPFPNALVDEIFRQVIPGLPETSPFDPAVMAWKIMGILPEVVDSRGFEELKEYLGRETFGLRGMQLACSIADTFDQYLLFRPDMILEWEAGNASHWQARLWRLVSAGAPSGHRAALADAFFRRVEALRAPPAGFPERISVFGISALPVFHLNILAAVSRWAEINIFMLNPCREFWGDLVSDREARRIVAGSGLPLEVLHLEKGNSLLASMGLLGRDFLDMLQELPAAQVDCFVDVPRESLLAMLQADILDLCEGGGEPDGLGEPLKRRIAEGDDSVQIHACHSPLREVEVLHDVLLDLFNRSRKLAPSDVLVMVPDIERYAPYIRAVFEQATPLSPMIPFHIADQGLRREGRLVDPFLDVLKLSDGRFTVSAVLGVLETPAVLAAFDLEEQDTALIRRWVEQSGIRWGIDGENRREKGLPAFSENTWETGLARLFLGYAMPGGEASLFEGILPYDPVEGSETAILGKMAACLDRLFREARDLERARPVREWAEDLGALLDALFAPDPEDEEEMSLIRQSLCRLSDAAERAGQQGPLDIRTVRWLLGRAFDRQGFGYGFMTGGVTFCAMLPMRSIPFKVICMAGLDHDAYPRCTQTPGFDLMAAKPRRGDRSRRNDDRYLFLETLISAREKFIMTFVGQSAQDNSRMPASVLVMELLDYLGSHYEKAGGDLREDLVTNHHLQAFHPDYFRPRTGGRLFSYSTGHAGAAARLQSDRGPVDRFITEGFPLPDDGSWREVQLEDLWFFLANPVRFLCERRLGLKLRGMEGVPEDTELFELKGLEKYLLRMKLVECLRAGKDPEGYLELERAAGRLPHGMVGRAAFEQAWSEAAVFWERLTPLLAGRPPEPLDVDLELNGFRFRGRLAAVYPRGLVHYRCARLRARDRLRLWIEHLVVNALKDPGLPRHSFFAAFEKHGGEAEWVGLRYREVDDAPALLKALLEWFGRGLQRPVPFFAEASCAFAKVVLKNPLHRDKALDRARSAWEGNGSVEGEGSDPYYDLCFDGLDPLDGDFEAVSVDIWRPLLMHQEDL